MIKIAIVEDEKEYVEVLCSYLSQYEKEQDMKFHITEFRDGIDIVSDYNANYDIILLDIQMKHLDGMKTAERIRELDENVILIFITSTVQFAVQGYSVNALGYTVKPVSYIAFSQMIEKAVKQVKQKAEKTYLTIDVEGGKLRLDLSKIYYIESQNHYVLVHTKEGDYLTQGPLKKMEEYLEPKGFAKCHNAYLVNLEHVLGIEKNGAVMTDGEEIGISRAKKKHFMNALTNYMGGVG